MELLQRRKTTMLLAMVACSRTGDALALALDPAKVLLEKL